MYQPLLRLLTHDELCLQNEKEIRFSVLHTETITIFPSLPMSCIILLIATNRCAWDNAFRNEMFRMIIARHPSTTFSAIRGVGYTLFDTENLFLWQDDKTDTLAYSYAIDNEKGLMSFRQRFFSVTKRVNHIREFLFVECTCGNHPDPCVMHDEVQPALEATSRWILKKNSTLWFRMQ
jgi:hypothetical protein